MSAKTCKSCRHCIIFSVSDTQWYVFGCGKQYTVNIVDGTKNYARCSDIRDKYPDCPNWELGGIKGFFKRLFKFKI